MPDLLDPVIRRVRLIDDGPTATGLSVNGDGVRLGACRLILKSDGRFLPRGPATLEYLLDVAYGGAGDAHALHAALWPIARKLDDGDMPGAMIRALLLGLPDLPDETARLRLESAEDLFKAGFDPDQERDRHGRWSGAGSSAAILRQAFDAAQERPRQDGIQVADASGHVPDITSVGDQGHRFRLILNGQETTALECLDCQGDAVSFPAFSGRRDTGAVNDAAQSASADEGPLPIGRYLIVDRAMGRAEQAWSQIVPYRHDWFSLIPASAEQSERAWSDSVVIDGVTRGSFRLHPEGPLGLSEGCITITGTRPPEPDPVDPDIEPQLAPTRESEDSITHHYRVLHDLLTSTPAEYLPGTKRRVYGVVDVVGPTKGTGR